MDSSVAYQLSPYANKYIIENAVENPLYTQTVYEGKYTTQLFMFQYLGFPIANDVKLGFGISWSSESFDFTMGDRPWAPLQGAPIHRVRHDNIVCTKSKRLNVHVKQDI